MTAITMSIQWDRQLLDDLKGQIFDVLCDSRCDNSLARVHDSLKLSFSVWGKWKIWILPYQIPNY